MRQHLDVIVVARLALKMPELISIWLGNYNILCVRSSAHSSKPHKLSPRFLLPLQTERETEKEVREREGERDAKMRLRLPFCDLCALPHEFLVTGCQTQQQELEGRRVVRWNVLNIILTFLLAAFHVLHFGLAQVSSGFCKL